MGRDRYLVLVAGGGGTRMGGKLPKQFMEICGKAVLHHTLSRFVSALPGIRVVTVLPDEWRETWKDYCCARNVACAQVLVSGGITRFHSVKNALSKIPDEAIPSMVHSIVDKAITNGEMSLFDGNIHFDKSDLEELKQLLIYNLPMEETERYVVKKDHSK